jgi:signal transduction histidine kinase
MIARARAWYGRRSIRTKLSFHLIVSIVLFVGLLLPLILYIERQAMLSGVEQAGFRVAEMFARSSVQAVIADDYLLMQHVVSGIASDPEILHAILLDEQGIVLAHSRPGERGRRYGDGPSLRAIAARSRLMQTLVASDGTPVYDFAVPVTVLTERRATARVAVSIARELDALRRTRNSILLFACGIMALGLAWATYQARRLTGPMRALVVGAREVRDGNLDYRLSIATHDELGEIGQAFNTMTDSLQRMIAELRESHAALAAAQDAAVRHARLVAIGELSAAVAHEIRNPLGAVSNCVQLLRASPHRRPDDAELLEIVWQETDRLAHIVSDFLAFGRPRPPQLGYVDIHELVQETADFFRRDERSALVGIVIDSAATALSVRADRDQLRQVFLNLLVNACEAMPNGSGTITVAAVAARDRVDITVSDSGPGIPSELQARIFEPLFTTKPTGSGLGLAIARRIVEAHGGTLTVSSTPGWGASFTCRLPRTDGPLEEPGLLRASATAQQRNDG